MSSNNLEQFSKKIREIFENYSPREAHERLRPVLLEMASDASILTEIIRKNIIDPTFLFKPRNNPVIVFPIFNEATFNIVANSWIPLPSGQTDISHQSVHHHGNLLLSSIGAFGNGYESILFKKGFTVDPKTKKAHLEIDKNYFNHHLHLEFIDSYTPHVVFFPKNLSITFATWSSEASRFSALKQLEFLRRFKDPIKNILKVLSLDKAAGVNQVENFDFFVDDGNMFLMQNRIKYTDASVESMVQGVFYILQHTKFNDFDCLRKLEHSCTIEQARLMAPWLRRLESGQPIPIQLESKHMNIHKVNLNKAEILRCFQHAKTA